MRRRLFISILLISLISSTITCVLTTYAYYGFYVNSAKQQLITIVKLTSQPQRWDSADAVNSSVNSVLKSVNYNIRFTIIDKTGYVIHDSWKDTIEESHKDRPEVAEAFEKGFGEDTRYSNTISSDMYYYATKLNNDKVLRLSREISSINKVFAGLLPMLFVLFIFVLFTVYFSASKIASKILKPINEMTKYLDMLEEDSKVQINIYEELKPLSNTIRHQKSKINEYINELKEERDTISFITENMKEGFVLLNHNMAILSINKSAKVMIGNERFELNGNKNILELTRNTEIIGNIAAVLKDNNHISQDVKTSDKHYRYYFSPVTEQNKTIVKGLLILIEDITIQKMAESMRSEFTANVSHELKTPLTTMIGFAEMMKEGLITDQEGIEKYSALIYKEGMRLIYLIEDLMRLSKIQENTVSVEEIINIKEISEEVVALLNSKAEHHRVKLILNVHDVLMKANRNYINELLYNLIDNGIKYNKDSGSVNIYIYEKEGFANIIISDTGVGIPSEHMDRIFERFYRVDKSRSKETGGTGLGLSIVKHIVELYDGTINIQSSINNGTIITIMFPITHQTHQGRFSLDN